MGPSIYDKEQADDDNWYDAVADYNTDYFPLDTFDNQGSLRVQKVEAAIITHNTKLIAKELCTWMCFIDMPCNPTRTRLFCGCFKSPCDSFICDRPVDPSIYRDHFDF